MSRLDLFRFCRALRHLGNVMILVVFGLVCLVFYSVFVGYISLFQKGSLIVKILSILVLISFFSLCFLLVWSYFMACFTDPGRVPPGWHPFASAQEEEAARSAAQQLSRVVSNAASTSGGDTAPQRANFCRKCNAWKPPRAHHCTMLGRCVLKLDHFCLWTVNAVGLLNQKFFLLFLFYSTLACTEAAAALLPIGILTIVKRGRLPPSAGVMLFSAVFTTAFAVALMALLSMHWSMLSRNYTSVEDLDYSTAASWPHDRGLHRNFIEVFGRRRHLWLLPVLTRDDRSWMLSESLEAELQPLVYHHKVTGAQLV